MLPPEAFGGWNAGSDVARPAGASGPVWRFGASRQAWIARQVAVRGGERHALAVRIGGAAGAGGGVSVRYLDETGHPLTARTVPLVRPVESVHLSGLVVPPGAVAAEVLAWGSAGSLEIRSLRLSGPAGDLLQDAGPGGTGEAARPVPAADFVPMIWGDDPGALSAVPHLSGAPVLLGFNEPDRPDQADMTVEQAVALWPALTAAGARLGSPAPAQAQALGPDSWLGRFMAEAAERALRVDFIAVHYYSPDGDVAAFRRFLSRVHAAYGRPLWVTEWGLADWADPSRFTFADTSRFLIEGAAMMDGLDFVERHAWFGFYERLGGFGFGNNLYDGAGRLTPVGEAFRRLAAPRDPAGTAGTGPAAHNGKGTPGVVDEFLSKAPKGS